MINSISHNYKVQYIKNQPIKGLSNNANFRSKQPTEQTNDTETIIKKMKRNYNLLIGLFSIINGILLGGILFRK